MGKTKTPSKTSLALELPIETGLDQPNKQPNATKILNEVEATIKYAKNQGSIEVALAFTSKLDRAINLGGKALGYAIYRIQKEFFPDDEDKLSEEFLETMIAKTGKAQDTVRKYHRVGKVIGYLLDTITPDVRQLWLDRPVQDLIALGQAQQEHGDFTLKQIAKLGRSTDNAELRKNLRETTGKEETDSTAIMLSLRKDGTIVAYQGDEHVEIGYLGAKSELGKKAVARIMRRSSIKEG